MKNRKYINRALLFSGIIMCAITIYYVLFPARGFFHADTTDTLLWAQASFDSKSILNTDYSYAAILPFGGSLIMLLLIPFFGVSLTTHTLSMAIFIILFMVVISKLLKKIKFSNSHSIFITGIIFLIIASSTKSREIYLEHIIYYSLSIFLLIVLLILFLKIADVKSKKLHFIFLITLFSFLLGTNGFPVMLLSVIPFSLAIITEKFLDTSEYFFSKKNILVYKKILLISSATIFGLIAITLLQKQLGINVSYVEQVNKYTSMDAWVSNFLSIYPKFCRIMGAEFNYDDPLLSLHSIINIIRAIGALIILVFPFIVCLDLKKYDTNEKRIILSNVYITVIITVLWSISKISGPIWRLSPIIIFSLLTIFIALRKSLLSNEISVNNRVFKIVLLIMLIISSISMLKILTLKPNHQIISDNKDIHLSNIADNTKLTAILENEGLTQGYGNFWNSQVIRVLSNQKIKIAPVTLKSGNIIPFYYQANKKWFNNVGKHFVIFNYDLDYDQFMKEADKETLDSIEKVVNYKGINEHFTIVVFNKNIIKQEK